MRLLALSLISCWSFEHPGVFVSSNELEYIRHQALVARHGPVYDAYLKALNSRFAHLDAKPQGPPVTGIIECGSYNKPNYGCSNESADTATAYLQSLLWSINGNQTYADNAVRILNAYSSGLKQYVNSNAPLQAAWSGMLYSKAAELLTYANPPTADNSNRPWTKTEQDALAAMLKNVTVPLIRHGSGCNGNWELSMIDAMAGIAVFTEDDDLFQDAITFWRQRVPAYFYVHTDGPYPVHVPRGSQNWNSTGRGGGSWYGQNIFNATLDGVSQETCRDLGHLQMGLASALDTAETARIQGVDLYTEAQSRLMAGMEFHAQLLVQGGTSGTPVPAYICNGSGVHLSYWPTFEVGFNEYAGRRNQSLPYTRKYLMNQVRAMPDPASTLIVVYETLSHGGSPPGIPGA